MALMAVLLAALCLQAFVKSKELSARSEARDRAALAGYLERLIAGADEESLRAYRVNLKHL